MTRRNEHKPRADRTGQPLALVECTGCGLRFTSAAKTHTNCPECRRNLRVNRAPMRRAPATRRIITAPEMRHDDRPVRQPARFRPPAVIPPPALPVTIRPAQPDDDDGETYIRERGKLVLGTWESGRFVPAAELPPRYLIAAVAERGWHMQPHGQDICKVVRIWPAIADEAAALEPCQRPAVRGVLCEKCFSILRSPA